LKSTAAPERALRRLSASIYGVSGLACDALGGRTIIARAPDEEAGSVN